MHAVASEPTVDPGAEAGGHLFEKLRQLEGTKPTQIANVHVPERLGLSDQPCPGPRVLLALYTLMHRGRMAGVSAGGNSHRTQPRSFIHTMAPKSAQGAKQRFSF